MSGDMLGAESRESALSALQAEKGSDTRKNLRYGEQRSYRYLYLICHYAGHSFMDMRFDSLAMQLR